MVSHAVDKRAINRVTCSLVISNAASASTLGQVEDISLDGVFVKTGAPLPVGSILPVALTLGSSAAEIRPNIQVVRHTRNGFGARFVECNAADMRKLRRYIADANEIANRQLNSARSREQSLSITDAARIRKIFLQTVKSAGASDKLTLISSASRNRVEARLAAVETNGLRLSLGGRAKLSPGETLLALHTHGYASYSFEAQVADVDDNGLQLKFPEAIYYSERRGDGRTAEHGRAELAIKAPWRDNEMLSFHVLERSPTGLSIRVSADTMSLWPGTPLPGAILRMDGLDQTLSGATVKNLTSMQEPDGQTWLRVGIATGVERASHDYEHVAEPQEDKHKKKKRKMIRKVIKNVVERARYLYHKNSATFAGKQAQAPYKLVKFTNTRQQNVVALLNRSFESEGATRCPLIIIAPGFAGRKETFSPLAMTIIHNFRQLNRDVAVLRLDGTNNLGESYKDPGCEGDGKHCLNFTLSGCTADILGAMRWGQDNKYVDPTSVVLISSSLSSISARKAMTHDEMKAASLWIPLMGPPDGAHPVANAMGNSDPYKNYLEGVKNGVVTLFGCLVDGDNWCKDMHDHHLATLADSRTDMAKIKADVAWMIGKQDAFIDPKRVEDVMSVKAAGKRRIIAVNSGHLPRSSDEAMVQFRLLVGEINQHLYGDAGEPTSPSPGWMGAISEQEWARVRKDRGVDDASYWKNYLVGDGGIGYDVWSLTPEYQQLMADQARLLEATGQEVLDLGAGTGNASASVAVTKPKSIVALDLVQEALDRTQTKVAPQNIPFRAVVSSADGNLRTAVRRWLHGDLGSFTSLVSRLPGWHRKTLRDLDDRYTDRIHGILRGGEDDLSEAVSDAGLAQDVRQCLKDIQTLAHLELGRITPEIATSALSDECRAEEAMRDGLPFAANSFDRVISSLVLSYMRYPEDTLSEVYRLLRPNGIFVLSSMMPDAEGSQTYVSAIERIKSASEADLPPGHTRQQLLDATHRFLDHATDLVRMEEEGLFHFWSGEQMLKLVRRAGFRHATVLESFGQPAQAVIVRCQK